MKSFYNAACELIDRHAAARPGKTAIYYGTETFSYEQLWEQCNRFGNVLKELGVLPGERILVALPDCPECVFSFLGSIKYGAWPILASEKLSRAAYKFMLEDSGGVAIITLGGCEASCTVAPTLRHRICVDEDDFKTMLGQAPSGLDAYPSREDDIAFMLYSSGSTGNPKGVPHRHRDLAFTANVYAGGVLGMSENDICYSASKLFFAYGLGNSLSFPLFHGASVVLYPNLPAPADVLEIISRYRPTLFFGVPLLYNLLLRALDEEVSCPSLRLCVSAGEALPAPIYEKWKKLTGLEILEGIGSTEALHIFISNRPGNVCPGAAGFLAPPYEAKIVDDSGNSVAAGQPGHLLIRGLSTAPFYWNRADKTSETMLQEGWLRTGDIFLEEAGCYTYQGRMDDMFKVAGNWVAPTEIERVILEHPAVAECVVTWAAFEGLARPAAFVVPTPGIEGDAALGREIRSQVLEKLPGYMCPVRIEFCTELAKTETGKIQRFRLRSRLT
ncbi:MAG: benzoate-CoA ligase family protein [Desulfobacteraceae bacterium]|nr:benzoate-CoA ligase family protein [Desulfobacteraceae bacterium]